MRTKRIKLYSFEELSAEAQQNAIENERQYTYEWIDLTFFTDDAKEQLATVGFENAQINYSLGYSQGDGLSFKADIDLSYFLDLFAPNYPQWIKDTLYNNISARCTGNDGRYCFASRKDIDVTLDNWYREYGNVNDFVSRLDDFITDCYIDECKKLERQGYDEIEYQQSDEYLKDGLIANDAEFLSDGTQY